MFREVRPVSPVKSLLVFVALFSALPYAALAQRGAGSLGGGTAGGGGLSGHSGIATGIDTKDDLKDFHDVLALQASSQQVTEYKAMLKSTESAAAELKTLVEQLKIDNSAELQQRKSNLDQRIEAARTANAKFVDRLSDRQKSGLREDLRKLSKADSDLGQEFKALDIQISGNKADSQQIATSAEGLDRALSTFRGEQLALGDEMSIGTRNAAQDGVFSTAPVRTSIKIEDQSVSLTTRAVFSKPEAPGDGSLRLILTSDMSDLQQKLTDILRAALNKSDACGEQIAVQSADLVPSAPTSLVRVQVHYERWACMGRGNANEMVEGNGTMEVKLALSVSENGTLALVPTIGNVDAEGLVGELLRSGSVGEAVRDKIADSVLLAIVQGADYKAMLPPAAQGNVKLQQARFQGTGANILTIVMEGGIRVSPENMTLLLTQLKAGEGKVQSSAAQSAPR
jgi:hypothetical protein